MSSDLFAKIGISIALVLSALVLSSCGEMFPYSYRFRMTVEAETPQGVRTGSSVYEVSASNTSFSLPESAKRIWAVKGEAVVVELPNGKKLFALLRTNAHFGDLAGLSMSTLYPQFAEEGFDVVGTTRMLGDRVPNVAAELVETRNYPVLIAFQDLDDPLSMEVVDPTDLSSTFGEGYMLSSITVAITDDQVSRGLEELLGDGFFQARAQYHKRQMNTNGGVIGNPYFRTQISRIRRRDFISE